MIGWWRPSDWLSTAFWEPGNDGGIPVYRVKGLKWLPVNAAPGLAYARYVRAALYGYERVVAAWGAPDVIHAHVALPCGMAGLEIGRRHGLPVVLTEHASRFSLHTNIRRKHKHLRRVLGGVNRVIAVSEGSQGDMLEFHPEMKSVVIGNVIETDRFTLPDGSRDGDLSKIRFLAVANLKEQKGIAYLVEAARLLVERGLDGFEVVIGGDGVLRTKLEAMVMEYGLDSKFTFLGRLSREQVVSWMQNCDVFVLPSIYESFCIVMAEAMSCGKPVIATRCGGPEYFVTEQAGKVVEKENAEQLAQAMAEYIERKTTWDAAEIRRIIVERFSPEAIAGQISEVYEAVVHEHAG
jgi:glycosyltransferase involved in cell wall biosynthesis